ncbi:MAG: hypothetical protein M1434_10420 [Chloroflexi bacterium]|nr:hypothetical protein [Chloroflexota bacterium]MCL5275140.1 hypothetical protein [Chloroflexota bacterium]
MVRHASDLPVRLTIARGATEIWAIDLAYSMDLPRTSSTALSNIGEGRARLSVRLPESARFRESDGYIYEPEPPDL